jgi:hypothetical protein
MAVRNSEALDIFLKVAADSRVSWRTVEFAGRGISADAAGVVWVISEGKGVLSGEGLSDFLIEQADLVDSLIEMWRYFDSGELSSADFEMRIERVIIRFEKWMPRISGQ